MPPISGPSRLMNNAAFIFSQRRPFGFVAGGNGRGAEKSSRFGAERGENRG